MSHDHSRNLNSISGNRLYPSLSSTRSSSISSGNIVTDNFWLKKYENVSEELRKLQLIYQDTDFEYKRLNKRYERALEDKEKLLKENGELKGNFQMKNKDNSVLLNTEKELRNVSSKYNELIQLHEQLTEKYSNLKIKSQESVTDKIEIENLKTQIEERSSVIDESLDRNLILTKENAELKIAYDQLKKKYQKTVSVQMNSNIENNAKTCGDGDAVQRLKNKIDLLMVENNSLKMEIDTITSQSSRNTNDDKKISERTCQDKLKISKLETELQNVSSDYNNLLREFNKLKEAYSNLEGNYNENIKKQREILNTRNPLEDEFQSLMKENTDLKLEINQLKRSSGNLNCKEHFDGNFKDESKSSKLGTELRKVSSDYNEKECKNVDSMDQLNGELQSLIIENTDPKSSVDNKSNMLHQSSQCEEHFEGNVEDELKISKLETELRNVTSSYNKLKRHNNKVKEDYSNLEKICNENTKKESEYVHTINQLNDEIESLKIENTHLQSEMNNKLKIDTEKLILRDRTIDKLEKVEQIKMERDKYMKDKAELEKEIEIKTEAIKRIRDKLMAAKTDNEELEALKRYKTEYLNMEKQLNETKVLLNEAQKQNEDTKEQLDKFKKDNAALNVEIKNIKLLQFGNYSAKSASNADFMNTRESSADERQRIKDLKFSSSNIRTTNHPLQEDNCDDNNPPSWWDEHRERPKISML